jgi:uncharacterized metal-binding protein
MPNNKKMPENATANARCVEASDAALPATTVTESICRMEELVESNQRSIRWTLIGIAFTIGLSVVNILLEFFKVT